MRHFLLAATLLAASQVAAALPPVGEATPAVNDPGPPNALAGLRLEDLTATRERPLFTPSRRPPPPPAVDAPAEPPPAVAPVAKEDAGPEGPPFDLIGSAVGVANSFVLLRNKATNEVVRLRPGDEKDGWKVGAVSLRSVALEREGHVETLGLANPAPGATPLQQLAGPTGDVTPPDPPPSPDVQPPPPPKMVLKRFRPAARNTSDN